MLVDFQLSSGAKCAQILAHGDRAGIKVIDPPCFVQPPQMKRWEPLQSAQKRLATNGFRLKGPGFIFFRIPGFQNLPNQDLWWCFQSVFNVFSVINSSMSGFLPLFCPFFVDLLRLHFGVALLSRHLRQTWMQLIQQISTHSDTNGIPMVTPIGIMVLQWNNGNQPND